MDPALQHHTTLLRDPAAPREQRIEAVRLLVENADRARVLEILREACADPACGDLLTVLVRSYGYFGREVLRELRPYLSHADSAVVESATKAMVALDPPLAVRLAAAEMKRGRSKIGKVIARVLAERCPIQALGFFQLMAQSARTKKRMVALVFLKRLPGTAALPLLIDMYRRETNAKVRALLVRVIARRTQGPGLESLRALQEDLARKAQEIRKLIDHHGTVAVADPEDEDHPEYTPPPSAELAIPPEIAELILERQRRQVLASGPTARPPAPVVRPSAPLTAPRPASGVVPVPAAEQAAPRRWQIAGVLGVIVIAVVAFSGPSPEAESAGAPPPPAHPLGHVGSPVQFTGDIISTEPARGVVVMKLDRSTTADVHAQGQSLARFNKGDTLKVTGVIRRISAGPTLRIQAFRIVKL